MMVVKRTEQEHSEAEGSRPKKKKRQDGTSRPACSWVHFRYHSVQLIWKGFNIVLSSSYICLHMHANDF